MSRAIVRRTVAAPVDTVFRTVADISHFSRAIPHIVNVEFLSGVRSGVGTRFRETRRTNGREMSTELEVTEYAESEHVRIVSDAGGTIWDTVFAVAVSGGQTELTMTMDARPYRWHAKLTVPFVLRMIRTAIEKDMDAVKTFCESPDSR